MIRPLELERDAPGVVELIHELSPFTTTTVESWLQQERAVVAKARNAAWVAVEAGAVAGRAEAGLKWWTSEPGSAYAAVGVREACRRRGIGSALWERVDEHLRELSASRVTSMFTEKPEGVAFARARNFTEVRAESLSCVDPRTVAPPAAGVELVALRDARPEDVYAVDMETTPDVPMTDAVDELPFEHWLDFIWRRPTITLDGSVGAVVDGRLVCITLLAANTEVGRGFTEYTATLREFRGQGLAEAVKRASLAWAAAHAITAVWTTNDETNAPMLAVNRRLGYEVRLRRVEYMRGS